MGTVDNDGNANLVYTYGGISYGARGKVAFNSAGHLVGTLAEIQASQQVGTVTIDLTKQ